MRIVLLMALLLSALQAGAEWVWYAVNSDGDTVFYYDPATVKRNGPMRRVWVIQDIKQPDSNGVRSRRGFEEHDCTEGRWRLLSTSTHTQPMAGGQVISSRSSTGEWTYIAPETVGGQLHNILCS